MGNLTVKDVVHAKPGKHSDGSGLILDVKDSGRAYWTLRYMRDGKRRDMVLGLADRDGKGKAKAPAGTPAAPDGGEARKVLSLLQARALAAVERERAKDKAAPDPVDARKAERAAKDTPAADTAAAPEDRSFRAVAEAFIATKAAGWKNGADSKHGAQWAATLETYAYPVIGAKDVAAVTDDDIRAILNPIWHNIPETASRLRGRIENVLDVARAKRWRTGDNPAAWKHLRALGMTAARKGAAAGHFPSLPYQQMPAFVHALRKREGVSARAVAFAILTGARSGEVRGMKWGEVRTIHVDELGRDCVVWHVPAERMKAKAAWRCPLSAPALAILEEMRGFGDAADALVFPGKRRGAMLSDMALSMLVRGMCSDGLKEGEPPRWRDAITDEAITVHGMRSSFRVWASATGQSDAAAEAALAHTIRDKVVAAYKRTDHLAQRIAMAEAWAEHVTRGAAEVVKIGERRMA